MTHPEQNPGAATALPARDYPPDVHVLEVDGREFILVGTAHVSRESADLVREVIEKERPDCVCIELDAQRFEALAHRKRWENLDLRQVIRERQLAPLLANLVLASYQKKLGGTLGVMPGAELIEAARVAERNGIPVALCDRDVRVTLRRAWGSMSFWNKSKLLAALLASIIDRPEIDEAELRRIRDQDVLSELMRELGEELPEVKTTLIDERDAYLANKILAAEGERIVAVVGAGHVAGIREALTARRAVDLDAISQIPPVSPAWKWVGYGLPALLVGSFVWIGLSHGASVAGADLLYWIVATGGLTALGSLCALAHPVVLLCSFFVSPITTLSPVIGAGHVLALVQAYVAPPVVREFECVADEIGTPLYWWRNRLLRIFLVFLFSTFGALAGNYVGLAKMFSTLF
jgi:pheromone shutdown-related protein TraB